LLWRTLLEGVHRAEPQVAKNLSKHMDNFKLIGWNYLYYHTYRDISRDLPWIDSLIHQHAPTEHDIREAKATHRKLNLFLYNVFDHFPITQNFFPRNLQSIVKEIQRYFQNVNNIGCDVREVLKQELRTILKNTDNVLLISHSMGSVVAYDALWELSHLENLPGKVDFLTLGSPLGANYIKHRLVGNKYSGKKKYPTNIRNWINISSEGDVTSLGRIFSNDFSEMRKLNIVDSIEDHCKGIYNFFHNEEGLNCHRSYGYLVNPAVGKVISEWWQGYV
jgi:hypothetical protein